MVAAVYRQLPAVDVRRVYSDLADEVKYASRVPGLNELVIVSDPENVLTDNERRLLNTGIEDERLRATFDLMPLHLRYALREAYFIDLEDSRRFKDYVARQCAWKAKSTDLLRLSLGHEPKHEEIARAYLKDGALFFYIRELFRDSDHVMRKQEVFVVPRSDSDIVEVLCGKIIDNTLPVKPLAA